MSKKTDTEIVKAETTAVAPADLLVAMEMDSGKGYETIGADDKAKPHLVILQDLTPICKESSGSYVHGARPGMFFNTVTNELIDGKKGLYLIPCGYIRKYIERGRGKDGQYIATLDIGDPAVRTAKFIDDGGKKVLMTADNTELIDVRYHAVLASLDGEVFEPVIIGMKKTQIPKSKNWNSVMERQQIKGPKGMIQVSPWYQIYHATTKIETKDKNSWYGWDIKFHGLVQKPELAQAGKMFHDLTMRGGVNVEEPIKAENDDAPF